MCKCPKIPIYQRPNRKIVSIHTLLFFIFRTSTLTGAELTTLPTSVTRSSHLAARRYSRRPWRRSTWSRRLHWSAGLAGDSPRFQSSSPSWRRASPAPSPESGPPWPGSSLSCAGCLNTSSGSTSGAIWCPGWSLVSSWYRRPSPTACLQGWSQSTVFTLPFTQTSSTSSWGRPGMSRWGSSASWAWWLDRYCRGSWVARNDHYL